MKKNKYSVIIGIPAYNSEDNIVDLLRSIFAQSQKNYFLKYVFVYVDASKDHTKDILKNYEIKQKRLKLFLSNKRRGMAFGLRYMLKKSDSDIFILLNDDILLKSKTVIDDLVTPFRFNSKIGLVSGNPQPLPPKNFIAKAGVSTFRAFERTRYSFRNGNTKWTCDGKILALSKNFKKSLKFPKNNSSMGNVDIYLYFSCLYNNFKYLHVRKAKVFSEFPDNVKDYIQWTTRGNTGKIIMKKKFGSIVEKEYHLPIIKHLQSLVLEFLKNPVGAGFIFLVGLYSKYNAISYSRNFLSTWEVVKSTKGKLTTS